MKKLSLPALLVLAVTSCGGATNVDLIGGDGGGADGGVVGVADGDVPNDGGPAPVDGGVVDTGALDSAAADSGTPDSGPAKPTVACGNMSCTLPGDYCCIQAQNMISCKPSNTPNNCPQGTRLACDQGSDCNGQICCGSLYNQQFYTEVSCRNTCTGYVNGLAQIRFCDPKAMVDECMGTGLTCQQSQILPAYYVCR